MKRILASAALLGLLAGAIGQVRAQPPPPYPYPPVPPPRYEPVPPPPGGAYVWEPGHWHWNGFRYVWAGGHYVVRGPAYGRYVQGHWRWSPRRGQYVWEPAHWQ